MRTSNGGQINHGQQHGPSVASNTGGPGQHNVQPTTNYMNSNPWAPMAVAANAGVGNHTGPVYPGHPQSAGNPYGGHPGNQSGHSHHPGPQHGHIHHGGPQGGHMHPHSGPGPGHMHQHPGSQPPPGGGGGHLHHPGSGPGTPSTAFQLAQAPGQQQPGVSGPNQHPNQGTPALTLNAQNIQSINFPRGTFPMAHQMPHHGAMGGFPQYYTIYPQGQMYPFTYQMVNPQQHQQANIHAQQGGGGGGPHQGGHGGGQRSNQGPGGPSHMTPSPSPGLNTHPVMQVVPGGGHLNAAAGPYEPRGHVQMSSAPVNGPAANAVPSAPPGPGRPPVVSGPIVGPGVQLPPAPVNVPPLVKRERKTALLQDPNSMEVIDLDKLAATADKSDRSGNSTPQRSTSVVSDTSTSATGAVLSGPPSKESTPTPAGMAKGVKPSLAPSATSNAKDSLSTTKQQTSSKEATPSSMESNNNKNNSNLVTNKPNLKVHNDGGTSGPAAAVSAPPATGGGKGVSGTSVPTPVALEFMTKVAQSVNEHSPPVINSNSINKQPEVATGTQPSSNTSGGPAGPVPSVVSTPPVTVNPGPPNYASVVMKQNQVAKSAASVPGTVAHASVPSPHTPSAPPSSAAPVASSAETSVPKSAPSVTSNRSTTSSSSSTTAPVHQHSNQHQQPPKVSFANKVVSGPPSSGGQPSSVTPKQHQQQTATTPTIHHVKGTTGTAINEQQQQGKQYHPQPQVNDLRKVDGDVKSSGHQSGMGSKGSKTVAETVAQSAVPSVDSSKAGVVATKTNEVKPVQPSKQAAGPTPATRAFPKASSTSNLQSFGDHAPHPAPSAPLHPAPSSEIKTSEVVKKDADSSSTDISSADSSVKPVINTITTPSTTSSSSNSRNKGLPAIPEVTSSSSKPSSVSSPSSEASSPSPTQLVNSTTTISSNIVNESKVTSTTSTATKASSKELIEISELPKAQVIASPNDVTSSVVDEESSSTSNEGGDKEGGRIIEEGDIDDEEDVVIEPAVPDIDPAADIDRFHVNGVWRYGRDDLLTLSKLPFCRSRPAFDKQFEDTMRKTLILEKPHDMSDRLGSRESPTGGRSDGNMFLPSWASGSGGGGSGYGSYNPSSGGNRNPPRMQNRAPYGGRNSQEKIRKIIAPPPTQDVQLHKVTNAWKAGKTPEELDAEEQVTLKLVKEFRGNLNKITPEKYDKILEKIKALNIDTEDRLKRVLDLVFDKAVLEPSFCVQYAKLCQFLSTLSVETISEETGERELLKFSRLLLTKCQKDFERDIYEGIDIEGKNKAIDEENDADKKKLLRAELDEEKRQARKKSLGNIKLIGELYRLGMLKGGIMVNCMHMLINDLEDDNLECLCTLLKTIGAQLEEESELKQKYSLDPYFGRLRHVVKEKRVGPRVRFLIQDILDMRDRGWVERERQAVNKPTTIGQIHAEVAEEERKNALEHERNRREQGTSRRPYGGRMSSPASIGGPSNQSNRQELASVIHLLKNNRIENKDSSQLPTPQLGTNFSRWGSGAAGSSAPQQHHQQQPLPSTAPFPSSASSHNQLGTPTSFSSSSAGQSASQSRNTSRSGSPATPSHKPLVVSSGGGKNSSSENINSSSGNNNSSNSNESKPS